MCSGQGSARDACTSKHCALNQRMIKSRAVEIAAGKVHSAQVLRDEADAGEVQVLKEFVEEGFEPTKGNLETGVCVRC